MDVALGRDDGRMPQEVLTLGDGDGSNLKRLTDNPAEDHVPCYSADGRWIYFVSTRSGARQIYRIPASGGEAVQMTHSGVGVPLASSDGRWVYYTKLDRSVWKIPANGGEEAPVLPPATVPNYFCFALTQVGIYYPGQLDQVSRTVPLRLYRFVDGSTIDISHFDKTLGLQISVSPDGRWFTWEQRDSSIDDLILVENFR